MHGMTKRKVQDNNNIGNDYDCHYFTRAAEIALLSDRALLCSLPIAFVAYCLTSCLNVSKRNMGATWLLR